MTRFWRIDSILINKQYGRKFFYLSQYEPFQPDHVYICHIHMIDSLEKSI